MGYFIDHIHLFAVELLCDILVFYRAFSHFKCVLFDVVVILMIFAFCQLMQ